MQKSVGFVGLVLAGTFLSAGLTFGQNFDIKGGTTDTSKKTLTANETGTVELNGALVVGNGNNAISVTGSSTISNSGLIEENGTGNNESRAIRDKTGNLTLTITNYSTGTIESLGDDAIGMTAAGSTTTIYNSGKILAVAASSQAVNWTALSGVGSNTLYNYGGGYINAGNADAVRPGANGVVYNDGTILGGETISGNTTTVGPNTGSDGIDGQNNNGITIYNATNNGPGNANLIEGTSSGITNGDGTHNVTMTINNKSNGMIKGLDGSGINIDGTGAAEVITINNDGLIQGNGATGDGDGVDVDGQVALINTGTIVSKNSVGGTGVANLGFSEGVTVGGGTINNSGLIEGSIASGNTTAVGRGITLAGVDKSGTTAIALQSIYVDSTITNSGTIKGDTESGIAVLGTTGGGHTVTITNTGTIEGMNSGVNEDVAIPTTSTLSGQNLNVGAIELDDVNNTYVINESGTITQDTTATGTAIAMHGNSTTKIVNTLNITGGTAVITGNIAGDTAADSALNISPGTGKSFSYGYNISNFTVNVNTDGNNGVVTLSGANTYAGATSVNAGTLLVANTSGSGTGTGKIAVSKNATLGGTGIIQPGVGNGITLATQSTLVSGGVQSGTTAGAGLTLDNTVAKGVILDASVGSATLTFSLGANHSSTEMKVLGDTAAELKFATGDTFALIDLTNGNLQLGLNTPYLLIQAGSTPNLLADNNLYAGIGTTGGTDASGNILNGYVTTPLNLTINGVTLSNASLFLNNGVLEVVPEPGTWALMLGGVGALVFIQVRRRQKSKI